MTKKYIKLGRKLIVRTDGELYDTRMGILNNAFFREVLAFLIDDLQSRRSPLLDEIGMDLHEDAGRARLTDLLQALCCERIEDAVKRVADTSHILQERRREALHEFVEMLYDYWRSFERFIVLRHEANQGYIDAHTCRQFNDTLERLKNLMRSVYRDLCENITGTHPRVYRQVAAGANVGLVVTPYTSSCLDEYSEALRDIPLIRQVMMEPPMLIDPPMNKRSGQFARVSRNPLEGVELTADEWLCYPAQVGSLSIFVYFHNSFIDLGCSLANLFEISDDKQASAKPDAIFMYGLPKENMSDFGDLPTVFYDDDGLLIGAIPCEERFGYFGYLKKMMLTLHNVAMMKRGRMPFHGAMVRITLKDGNVANVLIVGDTATGKSETLEALRCVGRDRISDMKIIADDMGTLGIADDGRLLGYGTEIGAFVRLDDLQPGYAFGQLDRAIIMSPQKTNARVVLPVTTLSEVLHGYDVNMILYANNYEEVDDDHPVIQRFESMENAMNVFKDGAAMTKGTTTSHGIVHNYFANIFGPPQYREMHDDLAATTFDVAFKNNVFVGQMRTRLALDGYSTEGPSVAAECLLELIESGV